VQDFTSFFKSIGPARIMAMGAVTLAMVAFFTYLIMRATTPQMAPLFTDLSLQDSSAVVRDLERQGIAYELRNGGAIVMVPSDRVTRLRMGLAESGLPKGGSIGYEIFDKSDTLGATSFVQNINHLRALEGELVRTIRAIDRVEAARVHLVLPERALFARERAEASASIVLRVRGTLEQQQVRAIRHLVSSAVNGLKPQRVSIVDETGRLLADGSNGEADLPGATAEERKTGFERRLREQIESIVTSVVGSGRARVQVAADFDFNRITQTSDRFDPEGSVIRSTQTREESTAAGRQEGQVTVANELPGGGQPNAEQQAAQQDRKSEEIVNYEVSRTTRTEVVEGGRLRRVSVAVVVDGSYTADAQGEPVYQPRSQEEMEKIAALVRSAIGFDEQRGDQVEVANMRLATPPVQPITADSNWFSLPELSRADIMRMVELGVMAILALIVLLVGVRPLVRKAIGTDTPRDALLAGGATAALSSAAGIAGVGGGGLVNASGVPNVSIVGGEDVAISNHTSAMIDIAKVQGQVHAESVKKVGELADKNPTEAVAIVRSWLHEQAA